MLSPIGNSMLLPMQFLQCTPTFPGLAKAADDLSAKLSNAYPGTLQGT